MTGLVFVPVAAAELASWAGGTLPGPRQGYAATPAMMAAFEVTGPEDAEYTALCIAAVAGLLAHGERVVAVAEAPFAEGEDEFGAVQLDDIAWSRVTSLFGEDAEPAPVAAAVGAVAGMTLGQAWEAPEVAALLAGTDLLWYGPAEWVLLRT